MEFQVNSRASYRLCNKVASMNNVLRLLTIVLAIGGLPAQGICGAGRISTHSNEEPAAIPGEDPAVDGPGFQKKPRGHPRIALGTAWPGLFGLGIASISLGSFHERESGSIVEYSFDYAMIPISFTFGYLKPIGKNWAIGGYLGVGGVIIWPVPLPAGGLRAVYWDRGRLIPGPYIGFRLGLPISGVELGWSF